MACSLVSGDTGSKLRVTCKDSATGAVINLTGATVIARWKTSTGTVVAKTMTVTSPTGGTAEYQFAAGEIFAPAMRIEVEITDAGGAVITSVDFMTVYVRDQIG